MNDITAARLLARLLVLAAIGSLFMGAVTIALAVHTGDFAILALALLIFIIAALCGWVSHLLEDRK